MGALRVNSFIIFFSSFTILFFFHLVIAEEDNKKDPSLVIFTVATAETDGFRRFSHATRKLDLDVRVLGSGVEWEGGDVRRSPGGGQKILLLKEALQSLKDRDNLLVLFTDSYDVVPVCKSDEIVKRFLKFASLNDNANVVFSAEPYCWPDKKLVNEYPVVKAGKRYLNSGGFIGWAPQIWSILNAKDVKKTDDDQLYFTLLYLDETSRQKFGIRLDSMAKIFQTLNGAQDEVEIRSSGDLFYAVNTAYNTRACFLHGNGASKEFLNYLGNYVPAIWSHKLGCTLCESEKIELNKSKPPQLLIAIFIERPTPFLLEFFQRLSDQNYPTHRQHLFLHLGEDYHAKVVEDWLEKNAAVYASLKYVKADEIGERDARRKSIELSKELDADFILMIDAEAQLTNPEAFRLLIEQNRPLVAPMLVRPAKLWSTFWGAVNDHGFYARSPDYVDLVQMQRKGIWVVPHINTCYMMRKDRAALLQDAYHHNTQLDPDISFSQFNREKEYFMHLLNREVYGHLVNPETFDVKVGPHPELYQLFENRLDWDLRYIHQDYWKIFNSNSSLIEEPCPDVYWFPFMSSRWCNEIIETMESFGKWSDGSNSDTRLQGGYENVPTRDIHMNQVDMERHWLHILDQYVRPVQEKIFIGYFHQPPQAVMNFVVRYRPDEQPSLRPHHDASTYTINLALNRPGLDYEGGGARFIRYNCSVVDTKQGWSLIHPGRLTHYHEGLPTTKGTRYIMISFVDP